MKIIFSDHARAQIFRRGITHARVLDAIDKPDNLETSFRGRKLYQKKFRGRILEVVVIEEDIDLIIITAYY